MTLETCLACILPRHVELFSKINQAVISTIFVKLNLIKLCPQRWTSLLTKVFLSRVRKFLAQRGL